MPSNLFDRQGARVSPHTIGRWGEELAAQWLKRQGFKVLYRNFKGPRGGEVDLVCREGDVLVFVEVKTRTQSHWGMPREAVNPQKEAYILKAAHYWLSKLDRPEQVPVRCDVVEVFLEHGEKPRVQNIVAALQWRGRDI